MLSSEGRRRSRTFALAPRVISTLCLVAVPGCLLIQPLDEATEGDSTAGQGGAGGKGGSTTGGKGGSTGGKGGSSTGGTGGASGRGNVAGSGGSDTGGGAGKGGGGGNGGTAGTGGGSGSGGGGTAGNVALVYGPVWTFDDDVQGFRIGYSEPDALGDDSSAAHDPGDGIPDDGSVTLTIPFDGPMQTVELGVTLPAQLDLTGKTLAARVKLDSGFFSDTPDPGGVKLFIKTGTDFAYADGAWSSLVPGEWITVVFDIDDPDFSEPTNDSSQVVELGVTFKSTAADASWTTGVFHVDTVGWVGAERPPCIFDPLLIDDMETADGGGWGCETDGRGGNWYVFDDETPAEDGAMRTPAGSPFPFPLEDVDVPRGDNTQAVHISGVGYTNWGGGVGITLVPGIENVATWWDASSYAGVSFWARGAGTMWVQANLAETRVAGDQYPGLCEPTLAFNCNDNYVSNAFTLENEWTKYTIPFATLHQEGWGHPVPWTYNLNAIEFRWPTDDAFDFWIDDVRFLERECDDDLPVDCGTGGERCRRGTLVATNCSAECSGRGYQDQACDSTGCLCTNADDPDIALGIDAMCVCGEPTLSCTPETAALLEIQGATPSAVRDTILCYAQYDPPSSADCDTALAECWPN